jgi:hypothetical protein
MSEWRYSSISLDLGTRWKWVFSFTTRQFYSRGNRSLLPLDKRWVGLRFGFEDVKKTKNLAPRKKWSVQNYNVCIYAVSGTWPFTLRDQNRLRMFEKKLVSRICRPKNDEVTRGLRKFLSEELHVCSSPNIIRLIQSGRIRLTGYIACMEENNTDICDRETWRMKTTRKTYSILSHWILNKRCECVDWTRPAQDRSKWQAVVNIVTNLQFP